MSRVPVERGYCCWHSSGACRLCVGGLWTEMGGVCGVLSRLVHIWVMYGMIMDQTQHAFPGSRVGELLRVCQQEPFATRHLCCCSADCL